MKKNLSFVFLFLVSLIPATRSNAQAKVEPPKYTISGHVEGFKDTSIYLANYYGNKLYYNDTTRIDSKGNYSFKGKPFNECGKYSIVMPSTNRFDIIVDTEDIVINCTADCGIEGIKVKESKNNKIFYDYIRFINEKMQMRGPIDNALKDSTMSEIDKEPFRQQLLTMNNDVVAYQKQMIAKDPDLLVNKMIKMSMDIDVPEAPADSTDDAKKRWSYYYYRAHYWDNFDLKDPRLVRDQAFHKLIERFVTVTLPQIPDTMTYQAKLLLDQMAGNEDGFKYVVHQFTYNFETSKIMCMDAGFVYMVDNYYTKGLCPWVKEDKIKEMTEAADKKRHCLCGETGLNIILPDSNGVWQSMFDLKSKYTLLVIWEATCGHCKKELPKLNELYKRWKGKGLEIYSVHNNLEIDKWKKFLSDENIEFTNVSRTAGIMNQDSATKLIYARTTTIESLNFHQYWDVTSTPKVYLMDKDHKVIAKSLGAEQLGELLEKIESGDDKIGIIQEHEYEDEDHPDHGGKNVPMKQPGSPGGQLKK